MVSTAKGVRDIRLCDSSKIQSVLILSERNHYPSLIVTFHKIDRSTEKANPVQNPIQFQRKWCKSATYGRDLKSQRLYGFANL